MEAVILEVAGMKSLRLLPCLGARSVTPAVICKCRATIKDRPKASAAPDREGETYRATPEAVTPMVPR